MQSTVTKLGRLLLLLAVLLWPAGAVADDRAVAAETFRAAEKAYQRGDHRAAAVAFEASHQMAPHGAALYNAGLAWQAADEPAPVAAKQYVLCDFEEADAAKTWRFSPRGSRNRAERRNNGRIERVPGRDKGTMALRFTVRDAGSNSFSTRQTPSGDAAWRAATCDALALV